MNDNKLYWYKIAYHPFTDSVHAIEVYIEAASMIEALAKLPKDARVISAKLTHMTVIH